MGYFDDAAKYGEDDKILSFLEKYGEKGNTFLDKHWGETFNKWVCAVECDDLMGSMENVSKKAVDTGGNVVVKNIESVANSNVGIFIGIALLLFVLFKHGLDFIRDFLNRWGKRKSDDKN